MRILLFLLALVLIPTVSGAEDYHVKETRVDGRTASVVFHIPVPVENNVAGVALRTAVSQLVGGAGFTSQVPWIKAGELIQLQDGELYEHSETVHFKALHTNGQKQVIIDSRYTELTTIVINKLRTRLKFWGLDKNVN